MKLKNDFITHDTGDEQIVIDVSRKHFSGVIRSNETAAFIVDCLKSETTPDQIVEKLMAQYDAPREQIAADVDRIIEKLRAVGALE